MIQRFVPPVLTDMVRSRRRWFSELGLDRALAERLTHRNGTYVEIGANDGLRNSNTAYFERELGWRGVLIEPTLNNFLACRLNRAPENHIACAACVPFDYGEEVVWLHYADLMTVGLEGDAGSPEAHAEKGRAHLRPGETVIRFPAAARPMQDILDEAKAPERIDLLSLDVEGAEISVLEGIDHDRQRFEYILVEARDGEAMNAYLAARGYAFVADLSDHHDRLFRASR